MRQIGTKPLIKVSIDTGDHKPIAKYPYKLSLKHSAWVKKETDKLLKACVIRESCSNWSAPVVTVPMSNNEKRPCVDSQHLLNSLSIS